MKPKEKKNLKQKNREVYFFYCTACKKRGFPVNLIIDPTSFKNPSFICSRCGAENMAKPKKRFYYNTITKGGVKYENKFEKK